MKKIRRFFNLLFIKLFKINDSPQKIALGLGVGVFTGIFPGTGPVAALFLALLLRVNRASALIGSMLTNTWLSIVTFLLSIKIGSVILGIKWQEVYQDYNCFLKESNWLHLFRLSILKAVLPVIIGYLIIGFCLGILAYLITLIILTRVKHGNKNRTHVSR